MMRKHGLIMPDLDGRNTLELRIEAVLQKAFKEARKLLQDELYKEGLTTNDLASVSFATLDTIRQRLIEQLQPILYDGYIQAARSFANLMNYGIDENTLIQQSTAWAQSYSLSLVDTLMNTTQRQLARTAQQVDNLPVSRAGLRTLLLSIFSLNRIDTIARTEITNAISAGEDVVSRELIAQGAIVEEIWFSQIDERVCPICAPRHGKIKGDGWQNAPPAHPRCRCYKGYRITIGGNQVILFDDSAVARRLRTG